MTKQPDILSLAREVLALAEKADAVLAEYNGQAWGVPDEARDIATAWSEYTTETKHGPGEIAELARFVERVDAVLRDVLDHATGPDPDAPEDEPQVASALRRIRQRLGLDTTEGGAALKARKETDR